MSATLRALHEEHSRTQLTVATPGVGTSRWPQVLAAVLATLSAFSAGTLLAWTASALPLLQSSTSPPPGPLTAAEGSWVGSLVNLGAFLGALPAGVLADRLGRQRTLVLLAVPLLSSWVAVVFATRVWHLCLGRLVGGMAIGAVSVATPMYVSEMAEARVRGSLGTLFQLQITVGILFSNLLGLADSVLLLGAVSAGVPVVFALGFVWMPESPTHLLRRRRPDAARRALQWFRGSDADVDDELTRLKDGVAAAALERGSPMELFRDPAARRALLITLGLMWFQQTCGVNAVVFYAGSIFQMAGTSMSPNIATIVVGAVMVCATYASTVLVDRAGRRLLLLLSSGVMSVCLATLAGYFQFLAGPGADPRLGLLPVGAVALFVISFSLGFGPIPWMMLGELFAPRVKGVASAVAAGANWLLAFAVTKLFQDAVDVAGIAGTFLAFTIFCVAGGVFVAILVPETKGKELAEIQDELAGRRRTPRGLPKL